LERISNEKDDEVEAFVMFFGPDHQRFVWAGARPALKSGPTEEIFKRTGRSAHEATETQPKETMLWTIFVVILILWLLGFIGHFGGSLIHLLLVIALVILIVNLISGRRTL
jgi:hypothetical protein